MKEKTMRYASTLGFLVLAALTSLAGGASASVYTSPAGTVYTNKTHESSEGYVILHSENAPTPFTKLCKWTFETVVNAHGPSTTVRGITESVKVQECTNGTHETIHKTGVVEVHSLGNGNGTVTWTGAEIELSVPLGFKCIYTTSNTHLGTLEGSKNTGGKARISINSSTLSRTGGSAFCGTGGFLTGTMVINSPTYLDVS
jgi:hypothetical protein